MNVVKEPVAADTSANFAGKEFQKMREALSGVNSNSKYQTKLFLNKQNEKWIDIEMVMLNDEKSENPFQKLMAEKTSDDGKKKKRKKTEKSKEVENDSLNYDDIFKGLVALNKNVVLRGRISSRGEMVSSYYKNAQKNLIAILFEFPNREIAVGDKWKLDNVHLIEMDQNFYADSTSGENTVMLEKIYQEGTEQIAVIKYNIKEYVDGIFNNPLAGMFGDEKKGKTFMKISHVATGLFSVTKGKWITYDGEMEIETNFAMFGGKNKTVFKLIE